MLAKGHKIVAKLGEEEGWCQVKFMSGKKRLIYSILFSLCFPIVVIAQVNQAVTYWWCGGRFGDKIIYYTFAKWISYKFNIPLLFKPFQYSSMLRLGREEKKFSEEAEEFEEGVVPIKGEQDIIGHEQENVIFEEGEGGFFHIGGRFEVERIIEYILQDQYFMTELKNMLQPVVPLPTIMLPQNKITVAVHIRKGGGFDQQLGSIQHYPINIVSPSHYYPVDIVNDRFYADRRWPRKFPPEQYYVDQIKKISTLLDDVPLFMHIFTDDRNPSRLVNRIKKAVNKTNITFSCRHKGNVHNVHVVEDFYNMACFDCLIRSGSNFGLAAQLLGNHKIIIYPKHWKWEGRKLIIDEISVVDNRVG